MAKKITANHTNTTKRRKKVTIQSTAGESVGNFVAAIGGMEGL
jgi:hypothetical protein